MKVPILAALTLAFALPTLAVRAADEPSLKVGDAAPALAPSKWLKGEPVAKFEPGKIYVVEFWATWCGPCIQSIPHISELQKQNPSVAFIGMNCMEQDRSKVAGFVENMGAKMEYRVAQDDEAGTMAKSWMEAAGEGGIPTAFVVGKESKIEWIGHPMELDGTIKQIVAGTFDRAKVAAERQAQEAAQETLRKIGKDVQKAMEASDVAALDKIAKDNPTAAPIISRLKLRVLLEKKDFPAVKVLAVELFDNNKEDAELLNELAWAMVDPENPFEKPDLDFALKAALRAKEAGGGNDAAITDTLARVHFVRGEVDKAIETQTKAVEAAPGEMKAELEKTLNEYKAAKK